MRQLRNFKTNHCYHLISRIANRAFFLTDDEHSRFVDRMWRVARFSGVNFFTASYSTTFTPPLGSDPRFPKQDVIFDLQNKAGDYLVKLTRDWRDENNKFDLDSKRRQTVDSLKHQFNREGK